MSKVKESLYLVAERQGMDHLLELVQHMHKTRETHLVEDVERTSHEINVAVCNHVEAVRKLDAFRADTAGRRADAEMKTGTPF